MPLTTAPPAPPAATDEAAFVAELRRLKTWSGRSFRQLERHAAAAGDSLPASTTATMLGKSRLPREELLVTFLGACGLSEDAMRPWVTARAAIADGAAVPRRSVSWRRAIVAAAALVVAFAGGAAVTGGFNGSTVEEETVVNAP